MCEKWSSAVLKCSVKVKCGFVAVGDNCSCETQLFFQTDRAKHFWFWNTIQEGDERNREREVELEHPKREGTEKCHFLRQPMTQNSILRVTDSSSVLFCVHRELQYSSRVWVRPLVSVMKTHPLPVVVAHHSGLPEVHAYL